MHPIVAEALASYRHGSGMLSAAGAASVDNDNPILQYAVFAELCREADVLSEEVKQWGRDALASTRVSQGYFLRSDDKRHAQSLNSHDNYAAIAVLEPLGIEPVATEICERGEATGYHFNNVSPGTLSIKAMRQLGDVAQYKINAGRIPNVVELAWMLIGFLILAFKPLSFEHHLAFARLGGLRVMLAKNLHLKMWVHVNLVIGLCIALYDISLHLKYGSRFVAVTRYYSNKAHPNVLLAKKLEAGGN
jgi:hypothetical protein